MWHLSYWIKGYHMNYEKKWVIACINLLISIISLLVMIFGAYSALAAFLYISSTFVECVDHIADTEYNDLRIINIVLVVVDNIRPSSIYAYPLQNLVYALALIYPFRQSVYLIWLYDKIKEG